MESYAASAASLKNTCHFYSYVVSKLADEAIEHHNLTFISGRRIFYSRVYVERVHLYILRRPSRRTLSPRHARGAILSINVITIVHPDELL